MFLAGHDNVESAYLQSEDMKKLRLPNSKVEMISEEHIQDQTCVQLTCSGFAHGVYVDGGMECSDNYFDILPGETKKIYVKNPDGKKLEVRQVL